MRAYLTLQRDYPKAQIFFLHEGKTFRKALYNGYKANRPVRDNELNSQYKEARELLKLTKANQAVASGLEADDLAGYLLKKFDYKKVLLISNDIDWWQFVNTKVEVKSKGRLFTKSLIEKRLGYPPSGIVIYKTLKGDSSDNIKGILYFGTATAKELARNCIRLGQVPKYFEKHSIRLQNDWKRFREHIDVARLNYRLVRARTDFNPKRVFVTKGSGEWEELIKFFRFDIKMPSIVKLLEKMK
jgi:DNA polymerase-1